MSLISSTPLLFLLCETEEFVEFKLLKVRNVHG